MIISNKFFRNSTNEKCATDNTTDSKITRIVRKPIECIKKFITLEPLVICYVTTRAICDPAFKNLELEKACRVNSGFNNTVCCAITSGLYEENNFTVENDIVQSHITQMHSWQLTVSNILTITLILLLGSYSDHYKIRKLFILTTLFGELLALGACILCVRFMDQWPLEVLGFSQEIIFSLFGGDKLLTMLIYAYITDISTPKMRTVRVAIMQAVWNICNAIGQMLSGAFLHKAGYMPVLSVAVLMCTFAFLYGVFVLEDSRKREQDISNKKMLMDIVNPRHIMQTLKMLKKYKGAYRVNIVCLLVVQYIYSTVLNGENTVLFLFTQAAYEWTIKYYSFYMSVVTTINSLNLFFIVPFFTKVLRLHDLTIIMFSFLNKIIANIIFGAVTSSLGLYIGTAFSILRTAALVGIRSQITKHVSEDDFGKILSICVIIDSFGDGAASQIYNNGIYEHTRVTYPQAFFLLAVVMYSLGIGILMWMYFKNRIVTVDTTTEKQTKRKSVVFEIFSSIQGMECTHL